MNVRASNDRNSAKRAPHGWRDALVAVLAGTLAMAVTAVLGLWAAGATGLPGGAFPRVAAAVVVMAAGGSVGLAGDAGSLVGARAGLSVLPLSVTLAGALLIAHGFLRPLRHRAVAGGRELAGWAGRVAVLWAVVLVVLSLLARFTFTLPAENLTGDGTGDGTEDAIGDVLGDSARVGFRADLPLTLLFGLLWLAASSCSRSSSRAGRRSRPGWCASRRPCAPPPPPWWRCCWAPSPWALSPDSS